MTRAVPHQLTEKINRFQDYLVRQYFSRAPSWPHANESIKDIAEDIISSMRVNVAPVPLERILGFFGARLVRRSSLAKNVGAQLVPTLDGFEISVVRDKTRHLPARWRFSIAHELGHTLFFSMGPSGPQRVIPKQSAPGSTTWKREEGLCDAFAAALLVPLPLLLREVEKTTSMAGLIRASLKFEVTPDVVIRRVLHDLKLLQQSVIYAVRTGESTKVSVFRGTSQKNSGSFPTARTIASLLKDSALENATDILRHESCFSEAEYCIYGNRTLYIQVRG